MNTATDAPYEPEDVARKLEGHMDAIMQLLEAMAAEDPEADMKLAALLEGEPNSQVRIAIVEKLRAMLRTMAAEKEKELEKYLEAEQRQEVERQRNVFLQWLTWIMSEETLRKIREAFLASPAMRRQVHELGQDLASFGVQQQLERQRHSLRELGELSANVQAPGQGQDKGRGDKGRGG
jgi:hypothetical protein